MPSARITAFLMMFLLPAALLRSQTIVGRWEKVDALTPGTEIAVKLKSGERIDCAFKSSGPEALILSEPGGTERSIPKAAVDTVVSRKEYSDGARDGLLKGLLVGLAAGAAFGAISSSKVDSSERPLLWGAGLVLGGGIGSLVGYAGDKMRNAHELLYRSR